MVNKLWLVNILLKVFVGAGTWWVMDSYTNPLWLVVVVTMMAVGSTNIYFSRD